jgi:hypothetical protein
MNGTAGRRGQEMAPKKCMTNLHLFHLTVVLEVLFFFELDICFQDFVLGFSSDEFACKDVSATSCSVNESVGRILPRPIEMAPAMAPI